MIQIHVGDRWARIEGLVGAALIDLLAAAPEPPFEIKNYLRTVPQNLLYLEAWALPQGSSVQWFDPQSRLFEAKAMRFLGNIRKEPAGDYENNFPFKTRPDPHQFEFFTHARRLNNIALAPAGVGVGKTKMALDVAADKFLRGEIDGVAIIAPNGVHRQWITKGVPEHLSDKVPRLAHVWSPSRKMPRDFETPELVKRLRILSFNVEAFSAPSGRARKTLATLMSKGRWLLIVDESQRIKNPRAERTKQIVKVGGLAVIRMILTGTPVTRNFTDFFSQYKFLDERIIGLSHFIAFRDRYCVTVPVPGAPRGAVKIVSHRNVEELFRRIAPVTFMIPASVLKLEEPWRERREVQLTPEQREVYAMLADKLAFDLRERNIETPSNALTRLLRLQQVLCGRVYEEGVDEDGIETAIPRAIPSNRTSTLIDFLEEYDGAAVIWARFRQDIDDIGAAIEARALKAARSEQLEKTWRYTTYDGRIAKVAEREARVSAFARGDLDYFLGNPAAGGTGVDGLQESCSLAIYYSNSFNREIRWQSEGRIQRRGQKNQVGIADLVAPGTVDELFLEAFASTEELANMVLRSPEILTRGL